MNINAYNSAPFRQVSDMETPVATASDIVKGIAFVAETIDDDQAGVVQRMAWIALKYINEVEALRAELFKLTHPRRDHFEKEGWPT